jgi:predicted ATPase/DNA-binding SARP family transcriptional activator
MLEVRFLGQFEVRFDGKPLAIPTRNAQSLFAYLVLNTGKVQRRERLAGLLWPDSSEENARSNLRHELWRLRKSLKTDKQSYFITDDLTIVFNPSEDYFFDVHLLESTPLEGSTTEDLIEALSAYQGELLPGFYEEWVSVERDRLNAYFEAKITRLLEMLQNDGRWGDVLVWGMRWTALGQWPEPAYRALMTAYSASGDLSKAAATYERFSRGVQKDLGIKPSEQTQALYKNLKSGQHTISLIQAPTSRNKSPSTTPEKAAPALTLPRVRHSNLPKPLTSFIGRQKELQQVEQLVRRERLVTVTGSGGVGKTRLAIQIAEALAPQFRDGVWWVELASLSKTGSPKAVYAGQEGKNAEDLVALAVAIALRIPEDPSLTILEGLLEGLREKKLLLVLDNCEHLIEDCSALAQRILSDCPEANILTTSREALGVPGEKAWPLPSLSLPKAGLSLDTRRIFQSEAVNLFIERARDVHPNYQPREAEAFTVAQICLRLDGIPLAIELAAARMKLLSAQEIADRLDHRFSLLTGGSRTSLPRHHTLRAAIEWSFDLLSPAEQVLFRRLSIFSGSFSLEAAEAICTGQEIVSDEVLDLLGRLVEKSLLNVEPAPQDGTLSTRYHYLDTIRSFGRLKLDETDETSWIRDQHADYYVRLAEAAEPVLLLQNQVRWFKLLQAEYDNMRAVIEWSVERDQAERALRVVVALFWFWWLNGFSREGRDQAIKALALPSARQFKEKRAQVLSTAGFFQLLQGDFPSAKQNLEEALTILRTSDDDVHLAWTLQFLGLALAYEKEYSLADAAHQESLALIKRTKDTNINSVFFFMGDVDLLKGDISRAKMTYEENAVLLRDMGSKSFLAYPLRRLGYLALEQNDIQKARTYFQESLSLNHEVGDVPGMTACLTSVAALAIRLDDLVTAARLCGVVENQQETLAVNALYTDQAELVRIRGILRSSMDERTFAPAFFEGWDMGLDRAIDLARDIFGGEV